MLAASPHVRADATVRRSAVPHSSESSAAVLESALEQLRLEGAIFFRSELTEGLAFESTPKELADALHPGARRLILFHVVVRGSCWVSVSDGERHHANEGDVIVVPYGDQHVIGGHDAPPWDGLPTSRHGGGGARTDLVCGYLYSEDPLFDPAIRSFPSVFVVRFAADARARWVQASIAYSLEAGAHVEANGTRTSTRICELVLGEVLRVHLSTAPAVDAGWFAALRDPVLGPALSTLHASPDRRWTVGDLAREAAVSRSSLDSRFRQVLGRSPIRYLAEWRLRVAAQLLATTDLGVVAVARRVGYESEEAFSRAFKRARGLSPSHWRAARSA